MRRTILVDTGPLLAYLREKEQHHDWAVEQFKKYLAPLITCEAVITEAAYLMQSQDLPAEWVVDLITTGALTLGFDIETEAERVAQLLKQYEDVPMDYADACMVRMAELYPNSEVLTLDSDFHIYRKNRRQAIPVISP